MASSRLILLILILTIGFIPAVSRDTAEGNNTEAAADEPLYYIGGWGGVNYNLHSGNFSELPGVYSCCPKYTSGDGFGYSFGGLIEFPGYELTGLEGISAEIRLGIATLGGDFTVEQFIGNNVEVISNVPPYGISKRKVFVDHYLESKITAFQLEPVVNYMLYKGLRGSLGFNMSYLLSSTVSQYEQIIEPGNATFLDGSLKQNVYNDVEIREINSMQFFGVAALGYELPISKSAFLVPNIRYNLPFTNISSVDWSVSTLHLGIALKMPVMPARILPTIRDTVYIRDTTVVAVFGLNEDKINHIKTVGELEYVELPDANLERLVVTENYEKHIPKIVKLETDLIAIAIEKDGTVANDVASEDITIVIEEIEIEEGFPLLPYIFFKKGSSSLSDSKLHLITNGEAKSFSESDLPWNTLGIYSELLNIIALRMQQNPEAKLVITGCNNNTDEEMDNLILSGKRARVARDYLLNIWEIDPRRIKIEKQNLPDNPGRSGEPDGMEENQRVELYSNDFNILKPVELKEIATTATPPVIEISPMIISEAGIEKWELNIRQSGRILRHYDGTGTPPQTIKWNITDEPVPQLDTPLETALYARDKEGQESRSKITTAIQQLTIKKKRSELIDDKRIEKFSLIVFGFNKADLSRNHKLALQYISGRIKPNSTVTIAGYTDRTGEAEYNRELAQRRAMEVEKALGLKDNIVTIVPIGKDVLLYDNNSPVGRSYSRTVQITIESPVKE